jgi:hypothetical protein
MYQVATVKSDVLASKDIPIKLTQHKRGGLVRTFIPHKQVIVIGISLCVLQILDGLLTLMGVSRFGIDIEGNPLLRNLMLQFGSEFILLVTKLFAILVVILLTTLAHKIFWIKNALAAVSCVYLFGAILPWTYILFVKPIPL